MKLQSHASLTGRWLIFANGCVRFKDERALTETAQPYGQLFAIRPDGTDVRQLSAQ